MIGILRKLPAPVWAMAMIYGVGGAMCLFAAAFPISPEAPIALARVVGCGSLVGAVLIVCFGRRLPPVAFQVAAIVGTLTNSVLVSACTTNYGAALNSFAYLWIGIYAGQFFEQRAVRVQCAVIVVASGVALKISGLPGMVTAWTMVAGSSVLASEALARVNSRLRLQLTTDPLTGLLNRSGFTASRYSISFSPEISRAIITPVIPASRMPFRPCPVAYQRPRARGSFPMIGKPSGVPGLSPAQVRVTSA